MGLEEAVLSTVGCITVTTYTGHPHPLMRSRAALDVSDVPRRGAICEELLPCSISVTPTVMALAHATKRMDIFRRFTEDGIYLSRKLALRRGLVASSYAIGDTKIV